MTTQDKKLSIIITGSTGMVGEGVLFACLKHPSVERILIVNRRSYGLTHPKLQECIVPDFLDLNRFATQLTGYNACFYCAGVSSVGMNEADYTRLTYDVVTNFARTVGELNPQMIFIYVSGASTDGTEKGKLMWARVKGKTENALTRLGFAQAYNFRPGFMRASPGQKSIKWYYSLIGWMFPILRVTLPDQVSTLEDVGLAMIHCALKGYPKQVLEIKDINAAAKA